ncbi:hypothetical protein [Pseudomonas hormoni]|nr:hypothetical protein [Pseudomonas hormoni]
MNLKYNRLPHAGDFESLSDTEIIYLSPRPIPTGLPPFSARQLHRDANDVFLDFAVGRANFEFMARAGIGSVMFITLFFLFVSGFGSWLRRDVQPFWTSWIDFFTNAYVQGFIWCLSAVYVCIFCYAVRQITVHPPIRFNRQRREVVFVPKKGAAPCYVPWEEAIACVSAGRLITQYAVMPEYKLMIGLRDVASGDVLWSVVPSGSLSLAVSEWEAIRVYMEVGSSALAPDQTEEFEEGSVTFFHLCRRSYRADHSLLRYVGGFLVIQFFSGWTLPCYISGWVNNRPKAAFPKEVLKWSKPLPLEQHAMPSEALLEESTEIRKAFAKGQNLLDYFNVKFADPAKKPAMSAT